MSASSELGHDDGPVLLLAGDATLRLRLQADLEAQQFSVRPAETAAGALAAAHEHLPSAAVLAVNGASDPVANGETGPPGENLISRLRSASGAVDLPVLFLVESDSGDPLIDMPDPDLSDFVTAGVSAPALGGRLRHLLRRAASARTLREENQTLRRAQRLAGMGSWAYDPLAKTFSYPPHLLALVGHPADAQLSPRELLACIHEADRERVQSAYHAAVLAAAPAYGVEYRLLRPDRAERWFYQDVAIDYDDGGQPSRVVGTMQDVTERREAEARAHSLNFFDVTTQLPNRTLYMQQLAQSLAVARRHGRQLAVLVIDIDHFKLINDSWGHVVGDTLLSAIAARLRQSLRSGDMLGRAAGDGALPGDGDERSLARLGGDEFAVLLQDIDRPESAAVVGQRLLDKVSETVTVQDTELTLTASIGISTYPLDGNDAATLLRNADRAMYEAKRVGRNRYSFHTAGTQSSALQRLKLATSLRQALERAEFELHYQPKISITGHVNGVEALVRWRDPERGLVSPGEFIPVMEATGLIVPLGAWVLAAACQQARAWADSGLAGLRMAVNLSGAQLRKADIVEVVKASLDASGLAPGSLELELTESMLMDDAEGSLQTLAALDRLGVSMSIDDFGTGYSSLAYLKRFPVAALKIDRSFVRDLGTDAAGASIVRGTISLAHSLGLRVVAEGVETELQLNLLQRYGCDEVQGFLYSPPLNAVDFRAWVEAHGSRDAAT